MRWKVVVALLCVGTLVRVANVGCGGGGGHEAAAPGGSGLAAIETNAAGSPPARVLNSPLTHRPTAGTFHGRAAGPGTSHGGRRWAAVSPAPKAQKGGGRVQTCRRDIKP